MTARLLEISCGALAGLLLCVTGILVRYVVREWGHPRYRLRGAVAALVQVVGFEIMVGWIWLWAHQQDAGLQTAWMRQWPIIPLGSIVAATGTLMIVRVFLPLDCDRHFWMILGTVTVAAAIAAAIAL